MADFSSTASVRSQEHYILHIAPRSLWEQGKGSEAYRGDTLDSEGFIHCSEAHQVVAVANTFFLGRTDLLLLLINTSSVISPIHYEGMTSEVYPHIYGPLNHEAVVAVYDFLPDENGKFQLPEEVIRVN